MSSMSTPLKMGVIGLGRMGQLYARLLATQITGVVLYAVAEVDTSARQKIADELVIPNTYREPEELLENPEVDAVIIATPTSTHAELVMAAAQAKKAIFCEKPLALTIEETRIVLDAVSRAQVALQVGFMRRFDAAYQEARALIVDGRIGQPVTFK